MVMFRQSYRPDQECIRSFNLRRAQDGKFVFFGSSCAIILQDNAGKRRWQGGHFGK